MFFAKKSLFTCVFSSFSGRRDFSRPRLCKPACNSDLRSVRPALTVAHRGQRDSLQARKARREQDYDALRR
jgi:hypothetical protein